MNRFGKALQRAARRVTWRVVGGTIAIALDLWLLPELFEPFPVMSAGKVYLSGTIIRLMMAFSIMFATLLADESVTLGANRLLAYVTAVVGGAALGSLGQWQVHKWLHVVPLSIGNAYDVSEVVFERSIAGTQPFVVFFEFLIWGSVVVFMYVRLRTSALAAERMGAMQIARAHAVRRTLESRLQALQARVEPKFLFDTLAEVRDLYARDLAGGGRMLDDLIVYLRAALPELRESVSTLDREVELASAYVRIMRERDGSMAKIDTRISSTAGTARVPAMVLLPLVQMLGRGGAAIQMTACMADGRLRAELTGRGREAEGESMQEVVRIVRARLEGLFGERARVDLEAAGAGFTRVAMSIPDETADRDHR